MKNKVIAVIAAFLAVTISVPAFAHQVSVVGGTDNRPVPEAPVYAAEHNFTDVSKDDNDIVNIAYKNGEVVGITDTTLGAQDSITLQDLSVILWNLAGCPDAAGKTAYNANSADRYAVVAVKWAVANNVVAATDNPLKVLSVSDVKQMLFNAGYDVSAIEASDAEVTKIKALRMIVKATKRESIMLMADLDHDTPQKPNPQN